MCSYRRGRGYGGLLISLFGCSDWLHWARPYAPIRVKPMYTEYSRLNGTALIQFLTEPASFTVAITPCLLNEAVPLKNHVTRCPV